MAIGHQSFYQTALTSGITSGDLVIPLDTVPTPSEGFLVIESTVEAKREIIYYTSKDATTVTCPSGAGNGRGYDGTTAVSHTQGAAVIMAPVGVMFEKFGTVSLGGINDTNGNELLKVTATGSAVNELTLANAATGNSPTITASGGDTNIGENHIMKGTGEFAINSIPMSGAWQSWTPTWTNVTVGNGTVTAKYKQVGKTVFYSLTFLLGNTSSVAGSMVFTLPVTSIAVTNVFFPIAKGSITNNSGAFNAFATWTTTTTATVRYWDTNNNQNITGTTAPAAWGTNYALLLDGFYEVP